ncbi:DUF2142 domain-containing protein [Acetobacter senegalensis]|uniref:DUF2142 domain-containing protein n=1 Tax=Acetobacter senegalensis TaxID=446692 RepID=UPI001EDB72C1|nr:DUF2142 domain-containing protein [Acetobacter senegalensis]MCG4272260.1 DUF2142 domain-containing protein [Acetobacter senegalensis]
MKFTWRLGSLQIKRSLLPIHWIYGIFMLIAGLECVVLTPPFQVADELNHFMRAVQIAEGGVIGTRLSATQSGGVLPSPLFPMAQSFDYLKFNPAKKVDLGGLAQAYMTPWSGKTEFVEYPNTAFYPPSSYGGVVLGIWLGDALGVRPLTSLYIARGINGLLCTAIAMFAIALAGQMAPFFCVILSLPMSVSLMASASQDGILLSFSALACALIGQCFKQPDNKTSHGFILLAGVILGGIAAAKVPYAPIVLLPLVLLIRRGASIVWPLLSSFLGTGIFLIWFVIGIHPTMTTIAVRGVSVHNQMLFVLDNPLKMANMFVHFGIENCKPLLHEAIGVLGWLDTSLPPLFYHVAEVCLILSFLGMFCVQKPQIQTRQIVFTSGVLALLCGSVFGIILALYLSWTAVGADHIEGVQGRYFLPLILLLPVGIQILYMNNKNIAKSEKTLKIQSNINFSLQAMVFIFMIFSVFTLYSSLSVRYWP